MPKAPVAERPIALPPVRQPSGARCACDHKFKVGQPVHYTGGPFGSANPNNIYKVTQLLPPEGDDFQYRIKSAAEQYERVAKESQLDRAA
jgi:hypothetical protein